MRNYKECDELTEQMSELKSQKCEFSAELSTLIQKRRNQPGIAKRKILTSAICLKS